jgi:hypothetical protein
VKCRDENAHVYQEDDSQDRENNFRRDLFASYLGRKNKRTSVAHGLAGALRPALRARPSDYACGHIPSVT